MRAWEWLLIHWPTSWRRRVAYVVAMVVFVVAALPFLFRIAGETVDFGSIPYVSLFLLCWVGEGLCSCIGHQADEQMALSSHPDTFVLFASSKRPI